MRWRETGWMSGYLYLFLAGLLSGPEEHCHAPIEFSTTFIPSGCNVKLLIRKKANLTAGFRQLHRYWASSLHVTLPESFRASGFVVEGTGIFASRRAMAHRMLLLSSLAHGMEMN